MLNLVLKDIAIPKRFFIWVIINCLMVNLIFINTPAFIYVVGVPFVFYSYVEKLCAHDYRYNVDTMFNSLPVNRRDIVFSKYIDSIVFLIFSIIIIAVFTFIFRSAGVSGFTNMNKLMHLDAINKLMNIQSITITYIVSTIFFISIYFPVYFKFEYLKVKGIFALVGIVICIIPILFIKIIGIENIYKLISYFSRVSKLVAVAFGICILFLIVYISVNLSVKIYERKEL